VSEVKTKTFTLILYDFSHQC